MEKSMVRSRDLQRAGIVRTQQCSSRSEVVKALGIVRTLGWNRMKPKTVEE